MTKSNAETPRDAAGEILADMLAVASGDAAAVDETVVVGQPASEVSLPLAIGKARSAGSDAPDVRPVARTDTASCCESTFAHPSAASSGPAIRSWPRDA